MRRINKYDATEKLIFEQGLRIKSVTFRIETDEMFILLSTGKTLVIPVSESKLLAAANENQLLNYELIANGVGVHWPDLDEDLSVKGFLQKQNIL